MSTYTIYHSATSTPYTVEAETPAAAIIYAANAIDEPDHWDFDGMPLTKWIEAARLTLPPLRSV